jgi:uncharacterized protein
MIVPDRPSNNLVTTLAFPILSHVQGIPLLQARQTGASTAVTSLDLGLTSTAVKLTAEGVLLTPPILVSWSNLEEIVAHENACFLLDGETVQPIRTYSELTGRTYSLMPTTAAPTMLVAGIPMHRVKGANPWQDTLNKIKTIAPIKGPVLDTTTGLGYTAMEAAKTADHVTTVELDPAAQEIARLNPWSQALFTSAKITQLIGDSAEQIHEFADEAFACIIHDPPMFSLAGDLYSGAFYRQAFRVLKRNGRMFHYIGNPESGSGARVTKGVVRRLHEAGFGRVLPKPQAFGVVAYK